MNCAKVGEVRVLIKVTIFPDFLASQFGAFGNREKTLPVPTASCAEDLCNLVMHDDKPDTEPLQDVANVLRDMKGQGDNSGSTQSA